jgi:hypothetical protein
MKLFGRTRRAVPAEPTPRVHKDVHVSTGRHRAETSSDWHDRDDRDREPAGKHRALAGRQV